MLTPSMLPGSCFALCCLHGNPKREGSCCFEQDAASHHLELPMAVTSWTQGSFALASGASLPQGKVLYTPLLLNQHITLPPTMWWQTPTSRLPLSRTTTDQPPLLLRARTLTNHMLRDASLYNNAQVNPILLSQWGCQWGPLIPVDWGFTLENECILEAADLQRRERESLSNDLL